jgi:polynucleotide 5'-hydroxyl-kinase GRC3/NOL9
MDAYVLDADIGQNDIGPPSVVSLGERADGRYRMIDGYFCGSTSPSRHFLQMIAGVARMLPLCRDRPVLINTTGLATGEIGRALKTEKINAVKPDLIIGLETGNELKYLDAFSREGSHVLRFRPHPRVTWRSRAMRESLRADAFKAHFQDAVSTVHRLDDFGVERSLLNNGVPRDTARCSQVAGTDVLHAEVSGDEALVVFADQARGLEELASALDVGQVIYCNTAEFCQTLLGLVGPQGNFLGLGILETADFARGEITIFSPATEFSVLQFGSIKIDVATFKTAGPFNMQAYRHKH